MLDLTNHLLPYASFIAGISGSLHCVGMCGGLVTASCHNPKDVLIYQTGRLVGYSILGAMAFAFGSLLKEVFTLQSGVLTSGLILGLLFIYWGIQSYQGRKAEIPLPNFLRKIYQYSFRHLVSKESPFHSFFIGLISIMLPCGLVYGVLLAAVALGEFQYVMLSLLFFWLGTLPAMVAAPQVVKKILKPLKKRLPKVYALVFIFIGLTTIATRLYAYPWTQSASTTPEQKVHRCH
ncbi:MAG: sulfite exporter TauE/SafE family protein [Bacteriovoracaceae bacterium]|nr:sulfite exporter TauE/SafE family protein [Bacteriovoracaceae bacterium]